MYSFGVLLWEMAAGQPMFAGMPWAQVMGAITLRHARPRLPPGRAIPSGLEPVLRMCRSACPADRPSFHEVRDSSLCMPSLPVVWNLSQSHSCHNTVLLHYHSHLRSFLSEVLLALLQ